MNSIRTCFKFNNLLRTSSACNIGIRFSSKIREIDVQKQTIQKLAEDKKFKQFRDEDSLTILDVEEERWKIQNEPLKVESTDYHDEMIDEDQPEKCYIRGKTGVFDIEDLIQLLNENKATNVFVARLPKELNYVDYIVIVSAKSRRHLMGVGEVVRRTFKKKRNSSDIIPKLEGENSDWVALDLGNIILHIMSNACRELYDLESLWGLGSKYDEKCIDTDDEISELLKLHSMTLDDFVPKLSEG
ncbi:mitochondrial assembly of ribosomal large subunit protein 1 [Cimex lectularius]|uniref:Mitochondrial assembly of ribosomal large subunit protein 1 n=1 Tax=Cimex lectularius TaxID=79782 RepID=A0A8I6THA6_CIMLE|nr:mitochondrial assembly of ribosomal large subunit protein 1 [Cimex lectularius]